MVGFYGEGLADYGFLPPIVERALRALLPYVDILMIALERDPDLDIDSSGLTRQVDKMVRVAERTCGYGLVVFHLDADAPTTEKAYSERFVPGYEALLQREGVNTDIVPVIPVRMTAAWMLVDFEAFCKVVGTKQGASELGFESNPRQVEPIRDPERVFESAVRRARPGCRRKIPLEDVYGPLGRQVRLDLLEKIPAYNEFLGRLRDTLRDLHYIEDSEGGTH